VQTALLKKGALGVNLWNQGERWPEKVSETTYLDTETIVKQLRKLDHLRLSQTLRMEAEGPTEMLVPIRQITRRHIPEY
jgi:hypothetical protein